MISTIPFFTGRNLAGLLLAVLFLFTQCEIINPSEKTPALLYIQPFELTVDPSTDGSSHNKITEVWVSVDGNFLGAFSLPALVPVLEEGVHQIFLQAGIRDNGILSNPEIYPFYEAYETNLELTPNKIDTIRPVIQYKSSTKFALIENFDRGTHIFQEIREGNPNYRMQATQSDVFEGSFSGEINLDINNPILELASGGRFSGLTDNGKEVYLEVSYKSDFPVVFGLVGRDPGVLPPYPAFFDPGFSPNDSWNKIYFNLQSILNRNTFDSYQVAFQATLFDQNGSIIKEEGTIRLDNIKLVHF